MSAADFKAGIAGIVACLFRCMCLNGIMEMPPIDMKAGIAGIVRVSNFGLDLPVTRRYRIDWLLRENYANQ